MTPSARVQAAIELLDAIIVAAREGGAAADTLIARYFSARRYAGSGDRRAVRELVYAVIRAHGAPPPSGRAALLGLIREGGGSIPEGLDPAAFDGSAHGPAPIAADDPVALPDPLAGWASAQLLAALGGDRTAAEAMIARAPLDIRVNRAAAGGVVIEAAEPIPGLPDAFRLPSGTNVEQLPAYRDGAIEVQDAGSQVVTLAARARPGDAIIDLCAGAGGKTLAMAAAMDGQGVILATDTDRARLSRLAPRAERAGATNIETRLLDPGKEAAALDDWAARADTVLIDAPCSGTGTWRRNPEARWRLTPDRVARLVTTQAHLLRVGARLVRPGGVLVYIVCSLLDQEGTAQVEAFLSANPAWLAEPLDLPRGSPHGVGLRLTPYRDSTDGFFVARLKSPC